MLAGEEAVRAIKASKQTKRKTAEIKRKGRRDLPEAEEKDNLRRAL
jgi:hypothetical protein